MIADPRSSLTETKSSGEKSSLPTGMPLIKSAGAANRQSPAMLRKFVALYHKNSKIEIRSDERNNWQNKA